MNEKEIDKLCDLYLEGALTQVEEKALIKLLSSVPDLSQKGKETLAVMLVERGLVHSSSKEIIARRLWIPFAAACLLILLAIPFFAGNSDSLESSEAEYVVWSNGKKVNDEKAQEMAEESEKIDMEMLRKVMRQQREMMRGTYAVIDLNDIE